MRIYEMKKKFFHATDENSYNKIKKHGLKNPYLSNNEFIAEYYAEEFDNGVILNVIIPHTKNIIPDYNGIDEPLTFTLKKKEDDIWQEWENSNKTWQDSLEIINTIQYIGIIHPKYISLY